ncbi:hypothetical protein D0Z06_23870 [Geodermatophilus marinus]|nr:hypothetical protein D0Z06_23870 [Geodermatophilus sp. LHW52908]
MGSRAAAFAQQRQGVEVFADGAWWAGSILGWRHDAAGSCEVRVEVTVAGVDRTTWCDLADLRLPQPHLTVAPEPVLPDAPGAVAVSFERAAARERLIAGVLTSPELPAVGPGGRAPEGPPAAAPALRRRRRHGGDVTAELPAVTTAGGAGRHRAPVAGSGRHRAAEPDTGVVLAAPAPVAPAPVAPGQVAAAPAPVGAAGPGGPPDAPAAARPLAVPPTAALPTAALPVTPLAAVPSPAGAPASPAPRRADDLDGLTRPIRLGDRASRPRLPGPRGA